MSMARTSANYIGPFSTNILISIEQAPVVCLFRIRDPIMNIGALKRGKKM
jgi:hypothetical protein